MCTHTHTKRVGRLVACKSIDRPVFAVSYRCSQIRPIQVSFMCSIVVVCLSAPALQTLPDLPLSVWSACLLCEWALARNVVSTCMHPSANHACFWFAVNCQLGDGSTQFGLIRQHGPWWLGAHYHVTSDLPCTCTSKPCTVQHCNPSNVSLSLPLIKLCSSLFLVWTH